MLARSLFLALLGLLLPACDGVTPLADASPDGASDADVDADAAPVTCDVEVVLATGDAEGHADPLGASAGEARAGRAEAGDLPAWPSGLATWEAGDFILANDHVAMVIEDAGPSDLYDPYGGKPVGVARVEGAAMVDPMDFGELFLLSGRMTVMADSVTVLNDGSDGAAAVVRAQGAMTPVPFFASITAGFFPQDFSRFEVAIDYVLEPDSDHVDIYYVYGSEVAAAIRVSQTMHGFMYTPRSSTWSSTTGFGTDGETVPFVAFIDEQTTSLGYLPREGEVFAPGINQSGFKSKFTGAFVIEACAETRIHHARLLVAGPGLDGMVQALARLDDVALAELTGVVRDASGAPVEGVRVHATGLDGSHLTRAMSGADGGYRLHVPADTAVELTAWRRGDSVVGPVTVAADAATADLELGAGGWVNVSTTELGGGAVPARIQVRPAGTSELPSVPSNFGEPGTVSGRLHVEYPVDGQARLRVPTGEWEVIVSRGYEYELHSEVVTITDGAEIDVTAVLEHVVMTPDVQCADFHIHTHRSNDSGDDAGLKLRSAAADGLDIPARSEHEFVEPWDAQVVAMGLGGFMFGMSSLEMTTFQEYGHFGVIPIEPSAGANGGAPQWQTYPTVAAPDTPLERVLPPALFQAVRMRPESPRIIINHPRGGNYFDAAGYDPATGTASNPEMWDEEFRLVEFFNSHDWRDQIDRLVVDWLGFLNHGRRVFAVGSSDSHSINGSPVGYPRTCIELGTDDPRAIDGPMVRDAMYEGHATISGGIYVDTNVGEAGPGDDATGLGATAMVHIRVQAASWVDVDAFDIVVDGAIVTTEITAADADLDNPTIRYEADLEVDVAEAGTYVIVAAYGDGTLDPVQRGRTPFGVTNPIFLAR